MSSSPHEPYVSELRHIVTVAGLNYEIWWALKSEQTRPQFIDVLNRYPIYFQTAIHAHFVALLVSLYKLYETRADTYNIPRFLKLLQSGAALEPGVLANVRSVRLNMSIDTDPQQQEAASPLMLVVRSFLRYRAG